METKYIKTNGIYLNVVQVGDPEGELVLLLHGFPEFWYGWRHQIDFLASLGFRVWIPDQRGYNLSDKPEGIRAYRIDQLVTDVEGLILTAGCESAIVIGHDWGAMVAWWTALRLPHRVRKLGILNVPHPQVMEQTLRSDPTQLLKSWYAAMFQMPFLPEKLVEFADWHIMIEGMKRSARRHTFTEQDFDCYREAWSQRGAMTAMMNWYRAYVQDRPQPPENWQITVPTRIIWGAKDMFLNTHMATKSGRLCDDADLFILDDATHWVQHDAPERVNELLETFIT